MTDLTKRRLRKGGIAAVILVMLLAFCVYENTHLVVTDYSYTNEQIPEAFDGYRIVQISDLHNARFGKGNARLIAKISALEPDMIVLTGDLVDAYHTNTETAVSFTRQAAQIAPVYFISGNHEEWLDAQIRADFYQALSEAGAVLLENETVTVEREEDHFLLLGISDASLQSSVLRDLTQDIEEETFTVLLAHEPQYLDEYARCKMDLVLTGHAHGGQFRLPFIGGVVAPDQGFFPEFTEGLHQQDGTSMIISRGLGNSVIPVRLFNDPEIAAVTLQQ